MAIRKEKKMNEKESAFFIQFDLSFFFFFGFFLKQKTKIKHDRNENKIQ